MEAHDLAAGGSRPDRGSCKSCNWRRSYKRAKRWIVYALARSCALALLLLPTSAVLAIGRALGRLAFTVDGRGRRRAIAQIEAALGASPEEALRIARSSYDSIGMIAVEIATMPKIRRRFERYVQVPNEDLERLRSAYDEGRGVVFVTGHVGNWELLAQRILLDGFDGATVAREAPNPFIGRWLVDQRAKGALETINRGDPRAARKILGALKRGALLGVLMDQDTRVQSVHVPFFGRPAATPIAAAQLALRRNAPVIAGFIRRTKRGHRVRLQRIEIAHLDIETATAEITRAIEAEIRTHPEEWVWFHDRWKTPPARS